MADAIIFDLDGTLYHQSRLRRAMLLRLVRAHVWRPLEGLRTARILSAYRRAQEHLRDASGLEDVGAAQLEWTCQHTKADVATVQLCVKRWIEEDPLLVLRRYMYSDLPDFLHACRQRGIRLGLFSDYPAEAKLAALGLVDVFDVVLTAQSPDVGALKPSPKGLRVVAERLAVRPEQCAYVGDRPEVDAAAARAAGMQCFILGALTDAVVSWTGFSHYSELRERLLSVDHTGGVAQPSLDPR